MARLILLLLFLILSVWLGLQIMHHPGYLVIFYQPWLVQMPIWFALLAVLVAFGLFYFLITSVDRVHFMWYRLKNWLRFRREHRSYSKTQQGLSMLIEGRWKKAERFLLKGVDQSVEPLMNYLGAAKAAHEQHAADRRDHYLQKAYQVAPNAEMAIGLTQADLAFEQGRDEEAIATLSRLRHESPRHPGVLKLLEKIYRRQGDWQRLHALLPSLRKAKVITSAEYDQEEAKLALLSLEAAPQQLDHLHALWNSFPRYLRKEPRVVEAYVKQLSRYEMLSNSETTKEMDHLIRKTLKHTYSASLAEQYGLLPHQNLNRQLVIVGAWLKIHGEQPELLFTLGNLCSRLQLWGKARDYYERCLAIRPNPKAFLAYGKLLEHLGELDEARQKYREGLNSMVS